LFSSPTKLLAGAQFTDGLGWGPDLSSHGFELVVGVGVVSLRCGGYFCDVFTNFVANVGKIACRLISVAAGIVSINIL
jgi:hypothetical protein